MKKGEEVRVKSIGQQRVGKRLKGKERGKKNIPTVTGKTIAQCGNGSGEAGRKGGKRNLGEEGEVRGNAEDSEGGVGKAISTRGD